MRDFDAVVIGLGATGSAALHRLASRGCRVLGVEQFIPCHDRGSSHGETRIFRVGYFEHPSYVPLLREAHGLWRELEDACGRPLLTVTGILEIGARNGTLVRGTLASSRMHGLRHELLDAVTLARRFPAFKIPADFVGVLQPDGGFLLAEEAIKAQLALASAAGAIVRTDTPVVSVGPRGKGVRVVTRDAVIDAATAIIAAGPWLTTLLPRLPASVRVTRQVIGWFAPANAAALALGKLPVFLAETPLGIHYGFPIHSTSGFKIAKHHHEDQTVDPDACDRIVSAHDESLIRAFLSQYMPAADGPLAAAKTCLYTMTADGDFIVDRLPGAPQVIVASPCSGHGFKFAPLIGDILADLVTTGETQRDISRFTLARFA